MRLVSFRGSDLSAYSQDREMLQKAARPCVLIIKLTYNGHRYSFAVPLRSNINPSTPKDQYFPLPPRKTTRPRHRHGIHYIKMFPVDPRKALRFRTEGNAEAERIKRIIDENEKSIIYECQQYLDLYAAGFRPQYSTDIDLLISLMERKTTAKRRD